MEAAGRVLKVVRNIEALINAQTGRRDPNLARVRCQGDGLTEPTKMIVVLESRTELSRGHRVCKAKCIAFPKIDSQSDVDALSSSPLERGEHSGVRYIGCH
jgi:hypothetical protein